MVPPGDIAPPALGTNTKVAAALVFAAKRSDSDTPNDVNKTRSPMLPLAQVSVGSKSGSRDVTTKMPVALSALTSPVTNPVKVTVTETFADMMPSPNVVMTSDVDEGAAAVPATCSELMATLGWGQPRAKNHTGKNRVIFPPDGMAPPPLGVNEKVAALPGYCATR